MNLDSVLKKYTRLIITCTFLILVAVLTIWDLYPYIAAGQSREIVERICHPGRQLAQAEKDLDKLGYPHSAYSLNRTTEPEHLNVSLFYRTPQLAKLLVHTAYGLPAGDLQAWINDTVSLNSPVFEVDSSGTITGKRAW